MTGISKFIVEVPKTHKTTLTVGGVELFIDPKWSEHQMRVGHGTILAVPKGHNKAQKGDKLFFKHEVTELQNPQKVEKDTYFVNYTDDYGSNINNQAIAFERDGNIETIGWNVLVKPLTSTDERPKSSIIEVISNEKLRNNIGEVVYINDNVRTHGLKEGDKIVYAKSATYAMDINGTELYRVRIDAIYGIIEENNGKDKAV